MTELTLVTEEAFGGKVYRGSVNDLEKFLNIGKKFSFTGKRSFLRTSRIPPHFFSKHPEALQQDLLTSMKSELKCDELLFIENNNEIVYVAPNKGVTIQDPKEKFACLQSDTWSLRRRDYYSGIDRYVYLPSTLVKDEYIPVIYIDIPILYTGGAHFEIGMYKVKCENGLLDCISSTDFKLKSDAFNETIFDSIIEGLINNLESCTASFAAYLNYLKQQLLTINQAKELVTSLVVEKIIVKGLGLLVLKYLDLAANNKVVDEKLPITVENFYDFLDVVTYYAQKLTTSGMQKKVEANIFKYLYSKYVTETQNKLQGLNIKNYVPGEQTALAIPAIEAPKKKSSKKEKKTEEFTVPDIDSLT